ncbi:ComEC/Rec2 family competence protein [Kiloniella antarctica]|uniref:ComEC/Rec2 family competence protein n=1 Tax=Kiloniella antarctica TaxID=1550907 RepID=A0ABW5BN51_9PROT
MIEDERSRLLNWIPVFFGLGIALYFSLPFEPNIYLVSTLSLTLWLCTIIGRYSKILGENAWLPLLIVSLVLSEVSLATYRSDTVQAPVLSYEIGPRMIEGSILSIEPSSPGQRYVLGNLDRKGFKNQTVPKYIRLRSNIRQNEIEVGDRIRARVIVKPPSQPVYPSGFNFARYAYYKQIGGVGYIWGRVESIRSNTKDLSNIDLFWNGLRNDLVQRIETHLHGDARDLAITFLTGQKGGISNKARNDIRQSGLAHLLAISGLHMGLVAGIIFFTLRFFMACVPVLALNYPIKKISAFVTFIICFGYLALIGMPLSAQRAFMMAGVSLFAIILDRQAISMRTVSVAALVLLILTPEVLISASFHLSFAAVIALVAVFEYYNKLERGRSFLERVISGLKVTVLCSLIASLATAPFVLYHFHSLPLYGILANLVAVPFTALVLMPLVLLSYVLIPFGLEGLSLTPLGWAFEFLLLLADWVSAIPNGEVKAPNFPVGYLALVSTGGLWMCLIKNKMRFLGSLPILVFVLVVTFTERRQDILIDGKTGLIAIRIDNELFTNHTRKARFISKVWQQNLAIDHTRNWRELPESIFRCDENACLYRAGGKTISFIKRGNAFAEDCTKADYIITALKAPGWCQGKEHLVIDYWDLRKKGVHSITLLPLGASSVQPTTSHSETRVKFKVVNVYKNEGTRPWVR